MLAAPSATYEQVFGRIGLNFWQLRTNGTGDLAMTGGTLPSWNDGAAKSAILDFVARVTTEGGPDFLFGLEN